MLVVAYEMLAGLVTARLATVVTETMSELVLTRAQRLMRSPKVFLGFRRISAVEGPLGTAIQIFDDDVVAFTPLSDLLLLLLISTTFPYLCDCWLGDGEAYHADGDCHTNECDSDTAQSVLLDDHGLSVRSHRSALAPLPGGRATGGSRPAPCPTSARTILRSPLASSHEVQASAGRPRPAGHSFKTALRRPIGFTRSSMMDIG